MSEPDPSTFLGSSGSLQDRVDTRRIADRIDENRGHRRIGDGYRACIPARDMFFLAPAGERGRLVQRSRFVAHTGLETPVPA